MLETVNLDARMSKSDYSDRIKKLRNRISNLQHEVKDSGLPVIIIFEGWSAAGKGKKTSEIIRTLDPRYFTTHCIKPPSDDELRKPFLWRHWLSVPPKGRFAIYVRSWYPEASNDYAEKRISGAETARRLDSINKFERHLAEDGALIVKYFLHISRDEQKKRLDDLAANADTAWRAPPADYERNQNYAAFYDAYDNMLQKTDTAHAPWHIIAGHDSRSAVTEIYKTLVGAIESALKSKHGKSKHIGADANADAALSGGAPLVPMPKLKDVDLSLKLDEDAYKARLSDVQARLFSLHNTIYMRKIPLVIAYEGWDAAGKGGNIKRVTSALDPRGYDVIPISAPNPMELSRPFLWRFWQTLPKDGHISIYDRTWYGRVLVERIEGFAREDEWLRAYREINEFEMELVHWGAVVVKFWLHIDKHEQFRRFSDRAENPEKQWKITDEDWRNREKWDAYESAVNDMLRLTSTEYAPWYIIESQNKRYARIKAIETLIAALEERVRRP
ncbi:MAG: polyphosphate:AMP phosphotransferase [Oscillospiraceae bacterium]|nr:polyphosphate:AMP phosphotransferase [Oscillospiraceae bacterium]